MNNGRNYYPRPNNSQRSMHPNQRGSQMPGRGPPQMRQNMAPPMTHGRMRQQMQQRSAQVTPMAQGLPSPIGAEGQYILYYSNYCINCNEFMNILCKTPVYSNFTKINVSSGETSFPQFVKSVPTIVVPKITRPLVGEEVFKWLEDQSAERVKNEKEGIIPYSPGEMGCGLGDNYSYLDAKDTEQPMEHTFAFIKRGDQKIETPAEDSFVSTKPKPVQDINRTNRPPFPQAPQRQMPQGARPSQGAGGRPPMIPLSSSGDDGKNVEDAYNELLARRKMDTPSAPQGIPPR